jgi:photosystem II stability/assembly factor-like uncharacterized protein
MHAITRTLVASALVAGTVVSLSGSRDHAVSARATMANAVSKLTPQGTVNELAVDPLNPNTVYAGTDGSGVFRSDNGGATWLLGDRMLSGDVGLTDLHITGMQVDPRQSGIVYVSTDKGVYKTTNKGVSWASEGPPTSSGSLSLAMSPIASSTIYAGTDGDGIYRSTNGGGTWSAIGPSRTTVQVVATDPISGGTIYAGTDNGLLYSVNNGGSWHRLGLGHVSVQSIAISAAEPVRIYVGTDAGILVSTDRGVSWSRRGLRDRSVTALHVDPKHPLIAYAAAASAGGLWITTNGGYGWHQLAAGLGSLNVHSVAVDPADSSVVYAGLDSGVFKSLQAGDSWASSSIYDRSVRALLQPGNTKGTFYAGTNGGAYSSTDGGNVWTSAGLGNHTAASLLDVGSSILAATEAGVYRTSDSGHTWPVTLRYPALALALDPNRAGGVLAGTVTGLYQSANGGKSWALLSAGSGRVDSILIGPGGAILAGGVAGVLISSDDGATFKHIAVNGEEVIKLVGTGPEAVVAYALTSDGHVYRTVDGGAHWHDASVGDAQVTALTMGTDNRLYAATSQGIYRSSSQGASWILTNQVDPKVKPLVLQPAVGGGTSTLLEGLAGQGVTVMQLTTTPASPFAPLVGAGDGQFVASTGHFVRPPFLAWYTANGGQGVFGPPITEAMRINGQLEQYFQRALLVYHPESADTPQVIELAPLGRKMLGTPAARIAPFDNTTTRRYFRQTGHSLSGAFLSFWRTYGGLGVFGLPISEPSTSGGTVVQYFQNARFEESSSAGSRYFNTTLSPLGSNLAHQAGWL